MRRRQYNQTPRKKFSIFRGRPYYRSSQPQLKFFSRKRLLLLVFIITIFALIFIPGPTGVFRIIKNELKLKRLNREIEQLKVRIELLNAKKKETENPEYVKKFLGDYFNNIVIDTIQKK